MAAANPADGASPGGCGPFGWGSAGWRGWWIVPLVLVTGFLLVAVVATVLGWGPPAAPGYGPAPFYWPLFPLGFFVVLFVAFFVVRWAVWGGRWWGGGGRWEPLSAGDVLRLRYARGELTAEQFRQMSRELDADRAR